MTANATAQSGALPGPARQTDSYVITMANQKGGAGKTMLTLALAAHTVAAHGRALVVDIDPQANAHDLTQVMEDPGYDALHELDPGQLAQIRQLRDYDTILVDSPGSIDGQNVVDGVTVLNGILAQSTFVLIPYNHMPESVLPTIRTARRVAESGVPYAAVVTMADPGLGAERFRAHVDDAWQTLDSANVPHFRSVIRQYRAWSNSLRAGIPITRYNERYAPRLREDIANLHTELLLELGRRDLAGATP